ncbi:MAG: hypothetical protein ACOCM7_07155, partial [Bacteroidales bacterium]
MGYAAGLNAEPACLIGTRSTLIPAAAVGARPLQTPQGKNHEKPVRPKYLITDVDNYFIENGFFLVFSLFCVGRAGTDRSL